MEAGLQLALAAGPQSLLLRWRQGSVFGLHQVSPAGAGAYWSADLACCSPPALWGGLLGAAEQPEGADLPDVA